MSEYLLQHGTKSTPQSERARTDQVENSAGGFVWAVDKWTRLRRFLILGSEGGSYYASERDLTFENITSVRECVAENGPRTVQEIVEISQDGRAAKNDPALYALAVCMSLGDNATKSLAAEMLPGVARIGTHLFHFVAYCETMRGWGRTMRWAVQNWFDSKGVERYAYDAVKYRQRDGWSQRDLLRLAHPENKQLAQVFDFVAHSTFPEGIAIVDGFVRAQVAATPAESANLIRQYRLPRECVRSEHLTSPEVWEALLDVDMPMTAMIRNLANMTRCGLLTPTSDATRTVLAALRNQELITKARIHPIQALITMRTYASGQGMRGGNTWTPVVQIVDALDDTFYAAFGNVEPTGKRVLLALDVSGSMTVGGVCGVPNLSAREAAAAMALVTAKTEQQYECVGFYAGSGGYTGGSGRWGYHRSGLTPLTLSSRQRLDDVLKMTANLPFGGTDCALPMLYATDMKREFDTFIVYTDSETWAGGVHPFQALRTYREQFVPNARLVVVGMVSNGFSIADPNDPGMLDVVGMDTATPNLIGVFARGEL